MHDDPLWERVNTDQKPLELYALIERVVMKQSGDEYQATNIVDNLLAVLTMKQQNNMSNPHWYERLNTRVDVAESVGVKFDIFRCMWEYCIEKKGWADYDTLSAADQATIRTESKERLLAYLLIRNSSSTTTHDIVRNNLVDAFIAKRDEYPTTRSDALALLNNYDEKRSPATVASEGSAFAQKGKKGGAKEKKKGSDKKEGDDEGKAKNYDNVECYVCGKTGHISKKCPDKIQKQSDDASTSSSKSYKEKIGEFEKKLKNAGKQFAQLKSMMENADDSSDDDDHSHFQFFNLSINDNEQSLQHSHEAVALKQSSGKLSDFNLREVILLDNQSTMSLFCNHKLVSDVRRSDRPLNLQSNGGTMQVHRIADIGKDHPPVWFSKRAITNILSLKEVIRKYQVSYDSDDLAFVVWREDKGLPNMRFKMHDSGLHFYDPRNKDFSFVTTVWSQTNYLFPSVRFQEQRKLAICTRALVTHQQKISNGFCNRIRSRTAQLRRRMPK